MALPTQLMLQREVLVALAALIIILPDWATLAHTARQKEITAALLLIRGITMQAAVVVAREVLGQTAVREIHRQLLPLAAQVALEHLTT